MKIKNNRIGACLMQNKNLESAISLLNDEKINKEVDILKNNIKDSDLCAFKVGVYLLRVIKNKKMIYQNNLEKQSYDEQILKLNLYKESVLYGLYSTDTFYTKRREAYLKCLEIITTEKQTVDVNQIMDQALRICSSDKKAKDIYLDIFSRNDYLAEMEDNLKRENSVAQMLDEMIDVLYKLQGKWSVSGKSINSHKLDKKIILQTDKDKGVVTAEFLNAQEQHQKMAKSSHDEGVIQAFLKSKAWTEDMLMDKEDIPKARFANISHVLQQLKKLVIFKKYLLDDYEKDAANQKEAILGNKSESKEKYYELYHTGRNSLLYLTKFVDHNNSQGAASVKTTLEAFYALIPKVYQYLKTKNSDDAWFEFLDKLDGICLEACCSNITNYCEKHPEIIDICINKERKHSGIYMHRVPDLKSSFLIYDVACKVIMQLMNDYNRKDQCFTWDEVKDEIAYHLANRKWNDYDFSQMTEEELINNASFNNLKEQLEENFVIQENDKTNNQPNESIQYVQPQQNQIENENYDRVDILLNKYDNADALLKDKDFDVKKIGERLANVKVGLCSWLKILLRFRSLVIFVLNLLNKNFTLWNW